MRVAPSRFEQLVSGRFEPNLTCRFFDSVLWRDRDTQLREIGLLPFPKESRHEIDRDTAVKLLATAMSFDLCYEVKSLGRGTAEEFAERFCETLHWQDRLFTNCAKPWEPGLSGWSGFSLTTATLDTGVVVKSGDLFAGLFWIASWD